MNASPGLNIGQTAPMRLLPAGEADIVELVALRNAVAEDLANRFGNGHWSYGSSEKGAKFQMTRANVYIARDNGRLIASVSLSKRKPWAIDVSYFTKVKVPLYLTSMAVAPDVQCRGLGRQCVEDALRIAREWPAGAIRLDAYDAEAGAGDFYSKCGFTEVGRVSYRGNPLVYFEKLL